MNDLKSNNILYCTQLDVQFTHRKNILGQNHLQADLGKNKSKLWFMTQVYLKYNY